MEHTMTSTLIIIPAAYRDTVNALIASHPEFPASTAEEFAVPLYPVEDEAQETPTHYWLAHRFTPSQREAITALQAAGFPLADVTDYDLSTNPGHPGQRLVAMGLKTKTATMPS
jgi:hypothetical protein